MACSHRLCPSLVSKLCRSCQHLQKKQFHSASCYQSRKLFHPYATHRPSTTQLARNRDKWEGVRDGVNRRWRWGVQEMEMRGLGGLCYKMVTAGKCRAGVLVTHTAPHIMCVCTYTGVIDCSMVKYMHSAAVSGYMESDSRGAHSSTFTPAVG